MAEGAPGADRMLAREDGFTIIEVVVAAALVAVVLLAAFSSFEGSRRLIAKSERVETATHIGQQELERMIARSYATVATASPLPTRSTDPRNPRYWVNAAGTEYTWNPSGSGTSATFVPASGTLPACSNWSDTVSATRLTGEVCRFVTWYDDPSIAGTTDAKRVTVAVSINGNRDVPVTFTSIVWDRTA